MKYIDSEKLIAEIERRMEERYDARTIADGYFQSQGLRHVM